MTLLEAIDARHSVRAYKTIPIPEDIRSQLDAFVQILISPSAITIRMASIPDLPITGVSGM